MEAEVETLGALVAALARPGGMARAERIGRDLLGDRLPAGARVVGLGWATVDLERAAGEAPAVTFGPAPDEPLLGAYARLGRFPRVTLVLLEPSTEGRLAAFLARFGEGVCVCYVEEAGLEGILRDGPLGRPGRLAPHDRPWGPFLVRVAAGAGWPAGFDGLVGADGPVG